MEEDLLKWEAVVLGGIQWDEIISEFLEFWNPGILESWIPGFLPHRVFMRNG